ncbi:MAG TPA: hypothetical protein VGB14_00405 [Acidimicrobiales bacterium]|jgi:hypothetical protein
MAEPVGPRREGETVEEWQRRVGEAWGDVVAAQPPLRERPFWPADTHDHGLAVDVLTETAEANAADMRDFVKSWQFPGVESAEEAGRRIGELIRSGRFGEASAE